MSQHTWFRPCDCQTVTSNVFQILSGNWCQFNNLWQLLSSPLYWWNLKEIISWYLTDVCHWCHLNSLVTLYLFLQMLTAPLAECLLLMSRKRRGCFSENSCCWRRRSESTDRKTSGGLLFHDQHSYKKWQQLWSWQFLFSRIIFTNDSTLWCLKPKYNQQQ